MSETFEPATAADFAPRSVISYSTPDPTDDLPTGLPAERYAALLLRADDLHKLTVDFETRHQAALDRIAAANRLEQLTKPRALGGHGLSEDAGTVIAARKDLETKTLEQTRLDKLDATRSISWRSCSTLLSNVKTYVRDGRPGGTIMKAIAVPPPKLVKAETLPAAIDRLRHQAKELRARLTEIERARLPGAYARAQLKEQLAAIAARGEINIDRLLQREDGQIEFPETQLMMRVYNSEPAAAAIGSVPDIIGMLVYANHDSLFAALDKKLAAAASSDAGALAPEQKQRQTAQVMETLFATELDEATLTFQAWQDGLPVEANSSINPAALLALRNVVAPPINPSPGTSPEHVRQFVGPR